MSATTISPPTATVTIIATATVTVAPAPIYFELCWSIMSTIGLFNTFAGLLVMGIVGFSFLALIPIMASIGAAIGNGLCFVTFYSDHSTDVKMATSAIEDLAWLVADFMIPLYSCFIVRIITRGRERIIHHVVFAFLMSGLVGCRLGIVYERVVLIRTGNDSASLQRKINLLHVGSFIALAMSESWNGYFLVKKFLKAQRRRDALNMRLNSDGTKRRLSRIGQTFDLYAVLARSTEVRLTLLAFVGIMRSITYPFQAAAAAANNIPSQFDRFAASIGYLVPVVLYIDLLASKLAYQTDRLQSANNYTDVNTADSSGTGSKAYGGWRSPGLPPVGMLASEINTEEGRRRESSWVGDFRELGINPTKLVFADPPSTTIGNIASRAASVALPSHMNAPQIEEEKDDIIK